MLPIGHAAPRLLLAMFTSCIIIVNAYFMSVVLPYFLKCIDRTVYCGIFVIADIGTSRPSLGIALDHICHRDRVTLAATMM